MKWISVNDELPKKQHDVLVVFKLNDLFFEKTLSPKYRSLVGQGVFYPEFGWHLRNGCISNLLPGAEGRYIKWEQVTHWQEIGEELLKLINADHK